ncbi:MAG TPA: hypothetical protein VFV39_06620 [Limnobacter sp.]|nr:hypothetical protein [Limnobacter sp.]
MQESPIRNVYFNLIAGRLPVGSSNPMKVVGNHAYAILGTNRLHVYWLPRAGHVYYFAVESHCLASVPNFTLPFTEVLPGEPSHQGDGVYLLKTQDFTAALILEGVSIRLVCNIPEVMDDFLLGIDLPQFEITSKNGKTLSSVPQELLGISERMGKWINRTALGTLVASAMVFVGLNTYEVVIRSINQPKLNMRAVQNDLNDTLGKLSVQQPLAMQLSRIQQVSATVVRSGGWIDRYTMKADRSEDFEITLPSWVSQDYLDQLGRDVVTDLRDMEGLLVVRKTGKGK